MHIFAESIRHRVPTEIGQMTDGNTTSVLNLGERVVLAARLAALEHVRQEMHRQAQLDAIGQAVDDDVLMFADELKNRWSSFFADATPVTHKEAA
jgi:hypothetical protein